MPKNPLTPCLCARLYARIYAGLCLLLLLLLFASEAAQAQNRFSTPENSAWVITGVSLESHATDATQARDQVFNAARRVALKRLWQRILSPAFQGTVPHVSDATLNAWVEAVRVRHERYDDTRYAAILTLQFRPEPIRAFLIGHQIIWAEAVARPLLVLPLLTRNSRAPILFEGDNPWLEWWREAELQYGLVPIHIPLGGLQDLARVKGEQAFAGDASALHAIAAQYNTRGVVVAHLDLLTSDYGATRALLNATHYRPRETVPPLLQVFYPDTQADPELQETFRQAAEAIVQPLQEEWRRRNLVNPDAETEIIAVLKTQGAQDWGKLRQALRTLTASGSGAGVEAEIFGFSKQEVYLRMSLGGGEAGLSDSLVSVGLVLHEHGENSALQQDRQDTSAFNTETLATGTLGTTPRLRRLSFLDDTF